MKALKGTPITSGNLQIIEDAIRTDLDSWLEAEYEIILIVPQVHRLHIQIIIGGLPVRFEGAEPVAEDVPVTTFRAETFWIIRDI